MNSNIPNYVYERPAEIELIRAMARGTITPQDAKKLEKLTEQAPDPKEAFIVKTAADWLQLGNLQQNSDTLFGDFWYEGELCILFADTNVGKSILAVQIGNALSRGEAIPGFQMKAQSENVLYFDFELSTKQFEKRYTSHIHGPHQFSPNFYRVVFNPGATGDKKFASYADYMNNALENILTTTKARIIIIDNITCLRSSTDSAASAISLMRNLQAIKNKYGLSVLVLAHTPKRNAARPITRNDLQGSKMILNFADSAFALGESQATSGLRYLKQIKQRSSSQTYGTSSVCLCRIVKPCNFLQFEFTDNGNEYDHLMHYTEQNRKNIETRILDMRRRGLTFRAIAAETNLALATVDRMIRRLAKVEGTLS